MRDDILAAYPAIDARARHRDRERDRHRRVPSRITAPTSSSRTGSTPTCPSVVFVGRITRQKGLRYLLDAALELEPATQLVLCAGRARHPGAPRRDIAAKIESLREAGRSVALDRGDAAATRADPDRHERDRLRLPVGLRAARDREPRGDGLRDSRRRDANRRHPGGRRGRRHGTARSARAGETTAPASPPTRRASPTTSPSASTRSWPTRPAPNASGGPAVPRRSSASAGPRSPSASSRSTGRCSNDCGRRRNGPARIEIQDVVAEPRLRPVPGEADRRRRARGVGDDLRGGARRRARRRPATASRGARKWVGDADGAARQRSLARLVPGRRRLGRWEYTIAAWIDRFASWRYELERKLAAGSGRPLRRARRGGGAARASKSLTVEEALAAEPDLPREAEATLPAAARADRRPRACDLRRLVRALPSLLRRLRGRRGGPAGARRARLRRPLLPADPSDRA